MSTELNIDVTTLEVLRLPIEAIIPHPLNPRPFSQKYKAKVYEDKVEELVASIRDKGYDIRESIVVRTYEASYQIVAGHHRWIAARECGMGFIPAFVEEVSDEEAAMSLINRQGKEVEPWCEAEHAYVCCNEGYGRNGTMTLARYAELRGKKLAAIGHAVSAFRVKQVIMESSTTVELSIRAARDIASLDEADWAWFGKLCLDREWGEKERQAAIKAVKGIDIPPYLQHWLDPQKYKAKAAAEATVDGESRTTGDVRLWTNTVQEYLESQNPEKQLPKERPVWKFKEDRTPYQEVIDVQGMFLAELFNIENPSKKKIDGLVKKLLDRLKEFDEAYKDWENQQKSKEERQRQMEEAARKLAAFQIEYAPTGFNADIRELTFPESVFDAVITDPPYLLSSGDSSSIPSFCRTFGSTSVRDGIVTARYPSGRCPYGTAPGFREIKLSCSIRWCNCFADICFLPLTP